MKAREWDEFKEANPRFVPARYPLYEFQRSSDIRFPGDPGILSIGVNRSYPSECENGPNVSSL